MKNATGYSNSTSKNMRLQQKNCKCDRKAQRISTLEHTHTHTHTFFHQISSAKQIHETARKFLTLEWLRTLRSENIDSQEKQERSRKQRQEMVTRITTMQQKQKKTLNRWWEEHNTIPQKTRDRKAINLEKKWGQILFFLKSDYGRRKKNYSF
jgi:membrane carboxypeptidase/penicillin-binding protein PbpC